jgi:serine phosphatase RsbU (regulator of sigma subunit)
LQYAGAFNPLLLVRNNQIFEYKADSQPIVVSPEYQYQKTRFSHQEIKIEKGDTVYVFTDGYTDQFGGTKRKKYLRKNFKKKLLEIHQYPLNEQKRLLNEEFYAWKGKIEQIDDVLVMGIKF